MAVKYVLSFSVKKIMRFQKWYETFDAAEKKKITRELINMMTIKPLDACNIVKYQNYKIVYKRFNGLYILFAIDYDDNELYYYMAIQQFVVALNEYFCDVTEMHINFNFDRALNVLDEFLLGGEILEISKMKVSKRVHRNDVEHMNTEVLYLKSKFEDIIMSDWFN